VAIDREIMTKAQVARVQVETGGKYCRGLTVIDERMADGKPANATVCLEVDREKVASIFLGALKVR
jgi:inosine-uridine nucleoside N-ribohydrolase